MNTKHTKGEWKISETGLVGQPFEILAPNEDCYNGEESIARISANNNQEANARLVAASPQLFEALTKLHDAFLYEVIEKHGKPYVIGEFPAYDLAVRALNAVE